MGKSILNQYTPAEYAAQWGCDPCYDKPPNHSGDGYMFYNFGAPGYPENKEFLKEFEGAIQRTLQGRRASARTVPAEHVPESLTEAEIAAELDLAGLNQLLEHVRMLQKPLDPFTQGYLSAALYFSQDEDYNRKCAAQKAGYEVHNDNDDAGYWYSGPGVEHSPYHDYESDAWDAAFEDMGGGNADDSLEDHFDIKDFAPDTLEKLIADCVRFQAENKDALLAVTHTRATGNEAWSFAGHDLWLSRNGHGAGFFDGDWSEPYGDQLQAAAEALGEVNLCVGDDGKIHSD